MTTKEAILIAAERAFGTFGYEGTSMRAIAETAGVAQALLHYHFQSKEKLYAAIFEYRSRANAGHRGKILDELLRANPQPTLEDVLQVLFIPTSSALVNGGGDLSSYFRLVATLGVAPDERSKELVARYFDPIAEKFIDVLLQTVPGLRHGHAVWCYLFAIGIRMEAQAAHGRAERLSNARGVVVPSPFDFVIPFVAAGIRAVASAPQRDAAQRRSSELASVEADAVAAKRKGRQVLKFKG